MSAAPSDSGILWPEGKRAAAVISVIFDDGMDAVAKAPDLAERAKSHSVWLYGARRGVERLCRTFEDADVRTSWFVPGLVAETHGALLRAVVAAGHELESHGWAFERHDTLSRANALVLLERSRRALDDVCDRAPAGF